MPEVRIDGVLYVPVAEASPDAEALIDALVSHWWGDGWQEGSPDSPNYLRVRVSDTIPEDEGESVTEFVARVLSKAQPQETD